MFRKIMIGFIIVIAAIQFIPKKLDNNGSRNTPKTIERVHHVPEDVLAILKTSCYDCHSNATAYPWYASIQPLSLWINHHVNEGKEELNFSEFGNYRIAKQYHKLDELAEQVEGDEMPIGSYTIMHKNAKLNPDQKKILIQWSRNLQDSIRLSYPEDSLKMKRKQD